VFYNIMRIVAIVFGFAITGVFVFCLIDASIERKQRIVRANRARNPDAFTLDGMVDWARRFADAFMDTSVIIGMLGIVREKWGIISWRMHGANPFAKETPK
jgi:hypothetical protein